MTGIDKQALVDEYMALLKLGWPEPMVQGYMAAKAKDLASQHADASWDQLHARFDEVGQQAHQGDPVRKARVDEFNDMLIAELKKRQANR